MWQIVGVLIVVICSAVLTAPENVGSIISKSNTRRTPIHVITDNGYEAEIHHVVTEDGYILEMQRIPFPRGHTSAPADRPVAFLMHGLMSASFAFMIGGPEYSIGYHLADAGFDVWLGNARGNVYSRDHATMDPNDPEERFQFFDFTWEEIGMLDLPAMIDYILGFTGRETLHYIGHSQGGTVFLVMASMIPEYNEKMATVHLLAGVGYMEFFPNIPLRLLARNTDAIYALGLSMGLIEVNFDAIADLITREQSNSKAAAELCFGDIKYKDMCELSGMVHLLNEDAIPIELLGLGGGSFKQIAHYGQNVRDRKFRRFRYSPERNLELYGSEEPPHYDISLITSNVTMHYTVSDVLLDERDVLNMVAVMPNTVARRVARDSFGHADFAGAPDSGPLVNEFIIRAINDHHNYNSGSGYRPTPAPGSASSLTINMILMYLIICISKLL